MTSRRDMLAWAALVAALAVTAAAEWALARACGFGPWMAAGVPAALDIYAVRALRARRDVAAVVGAMIVVQGLAHLVAAHLLAVSVPLVVAVSAIAPLVLWRVHQIGHDTAVPVPEPVPVLAPVPEPVLEPGPVPVLVPEAEAVPAVAPEPVPVPEVEPVQLAVIGDPVPYSTTPHLVVDRSRRTRTAAADSDRATVRVPAPADTGLIETARGEYAAVLADGGAPSVRALRTRYGIGQVRAQRVRDALAA